MQTQSMFQPEFHITDIVRPIHSPNEAQARIAIKLTIKPDPRNSTDHETQYCGNLRCFKIIKSLIILFTILFLFIYLFIYLVSTLSCMLTKPLMLQAVFHQWLTSHVNE